MGILTLLWAKFWKYVVALGALLLAIGAIFLKGRSNGVKSMQTKVDAAKEETAAATVTTKILESRHETDVSVQQLPDAPQGVSLGDAPADSSAGKLSDWAN